MLSNYALSNPARLPKGHNSRRAPCLAGHPELVLSEIQRWPGVNSTVFYAQSPDLRFAPLMTDMDFAVSRPLVRYWHIRFLFIDPHVCFTLTSIRLGEGLAQGLSPPSC